MKKRKKEDLNVRKSYKKKITKKKDRDVKFEKNELRVDGTNVNDEMY